MKKYNKPQLLFIILAIIVCVETSLAQNYQSPPPFDIHVPLGNTGLKTVSYDINTDLLKEDFPLRASVTIEFKNTNEDPQKSVNLYLHPELHVDNIQTLSGDSLQFETRLVKYWLATTLLAKETSLTLPRPLLSGETIAITIDYHGWLNNSTVRGSMSDGYIGIFEEKAFLRLFGYCQWLPLLHTTPIGIEDMVNFRLNISVPSSLQIVAPGELESEELTSERRLAVWNSVYPIGLENYSVWIDSWKVIADDNIKVYYHDNKAATRKYLETCTEIKNWYEKLYSIGIPQENMKIPYSIVQLDVQTGGYESQNMVGFARSRFIGKFSFSDLTWISHEMIPQYLNIPIDIDKPGSQVIGDGFNLFFNLPVLELIEGSEFRQWDLEKRWKQYENGLAGRPDHEGPIPPDIPLANISPSDYMLYKDRFLTADKEQIILWHLMDMVGKEVFFSGFQNYLKEHRNKPATLASFQVALENASGISLDDFFHRWFFTTEKLPDSWRPESKGKE